MGGGPINDIEGGRGADNGEGGHGGVGRGQMGALTGAARKTAVDALTTSTEEVDDAARGMNEAKN